MRSTSSRRMVCRTIEIIFFIAGLSVLETV
jgi:hypothetical protein